jgi:thiosulfate/3-mercaptopyruvate sulfurtransferase
LSEALKPYRNNGIIVLYSNGMTHPAQAADALYRMGFENVYILTDGLKGFIEICLKPVSLRSEPVPAELAARIKEWRRFFYAEASHAANGLASAKSGSPQAERATRLPENLPGMVESEWLASNLGKAGLKIIDLRTQPEYNTNHIPGSFYLSVETFRGVVGGVPSLLLPVEILALHMEQMGIEPSDLVILVPGDAVRDATLAAMAFERLGHRSYALLDGGFGKWSAENRPVDTRLPVAAKSSYPVAAGRTDNFTVDYRTVLDLMKQPGTVILDVRPEEYYLGNKTDEARPGRIPGAVNRPFSEDILERDGYSRLRPIEELDSVYGSLVPSKETTVVVHCRTGHQASQTFFVLNNLLGYKRVLYYDAGWTEWAARPELPVETGPPGS